MLFCSVNFQTINTIAVTERGLAYGDGVFTTAKIIQGKVEYLTAHIQRLQNACQALAITPFDHHQLIEYLHPIAAQFELAVLKIMITAGASGRGYARAQHYSPTVIVQINEFPSHYATWQQQGVSLGVSTAQLGINPLLAGIKHLNRLEQVVIKQRLDETAVDDVLVLDINNTIVEASCANVFWQKNGQWYTPKITHAGIAGLMRERILAMYANIQQVQWQVSDLNQIDAMFICNSLMHIVPVHTFLAQQLNIQAVLAFAQNFAQQCATLPYQSEHNA